MKLNQDISRRDFLKLSGYLAGASILPAVKPLAVPGKQDYPIGKKLGRVCVGEFRSWVDMKSEPNMNAPAVARAWRDESFPDGGVRTARSVWHQSPLPALFWGPRGVPRKLRRSGLTRRKEA